MTEKNFDTVPNQHIYVIHREETGNNFISISKSNYSKAYKDMSSKPSALGLYIWLVGNKDKYKFAFSPQAIENQLGMARSSCHGAVEHLKNLGYLVQRKDSNIYDFYEISTKNNTVDTKEIESTVLNFEDAPSPVEAPIQSPVVKHVEFNF
jgi:biotin operon repressor